MSKKIKIPGKTLEQLSRCADTLRHEREKSLAIPRYMPDGTLVDTLSKAVVMTGVSEYRVALAVMDTKGVHPRLRKAAHAVLRPAPASDRDGVAIMLQPSVGAASVLHGAVSSAVPPEDLHVTLAYYGSLGSDAGKIPSKSTLLTWCQELAYVQESFFAPISGLIRFNGGESDPVVLSPDHSVIEDLRLHILMLSSGRMVRNHGFTPHMTIGYINADEELPFSRMPKVDDVLFEYITLGYGDEYHRFPLKSTGKKDLHNGSVPAVQGRGFGRAHRIDRLVERAKRHEPKKKYGIELVPNNTRKVTL